ncbi:hypothetical protein Tco_1273408 [Tanacetum coccineum]
MGFFLAQRKSVIQQGDGSNSAKGGNLQDPKRIIYLAIEIPEEYTLGEEKEYAEDVLSTEDVLSNGRCTDEQRKDTDDHTEEGSANQTTQPPPLILQYFDIEETNRPRPTSTRSLLTLKPLPKIDPKDKGKKKIEKEDETESESDGILEAENKKRRFRQNTSEDDSEKENDELRLCLTIAPDEDKEVDYEILDKKYPIIEWKTEYLGNNHKNQEEDTEGI